MRLFLSGVTPNSPSRTSLLAPNRYRPGWAVPRRAWCWTRLKFLLWPHGNHEKEKGLMGEGPRSALGRPRRDRILDRARNQRFIRERIRSQECPLNTAPATSLKERFNRRSANFAQDCAIAGDHGRPFPRLHPPRPPRWRGSRGELSLITTGRSRWFRPITTTSCPCS